ncbi:MAG TPA: hypothetical protein VN841_14750 [Bryobacteraceae bacterium]|nr:hypothetical protein [Bryobacteraceae bacterium]
MKLKDAGTRGSSGGRRPPPGKIGTFRPPGSIRMEWMDPLSWRLPSGKALAEFALQAGFLAPLMLVGPRYKKPKKAPGSAADGAVAEKQFTEVPGSSGSFRETDF